MAINSHCIKYIHIPFKEYYFLKFSFFWYINFSKFFYNTLSARISASSSKDFKSFGGINFLFLIMSNLSKLEFLALDISGKSYLSWVLDAEIHLDAMGLADTIQENIKHRIKTVLRRWYFSFITLMRVWKWNISLLRILWCCGTI